MSFMMTDSELSQSAVEYTEVTHINQPYGGSIYADMTYEEVIYADVSYEDLAYEDIAYLLKNSKLISEETESERSWKKTQRRIDSK